MRKIHFAVILAFLLFLLTALSAGSASAVAFPPPAPREPWFDNLPEEFLTEQADDDFQRIIDEIRRQQDVRFSPDPHQIAVYEDYFFNDFSDEDWDQLDRDIRDARLGQHWLEIQEDLELREIDHQAMRLVQEFAAAAHAVPPMPGVNGAVAFAFGSHIPRIVTRPNRVTNIMLQPGERVTGVHSGDTTRWQITPAISGTGVNETVHVIVMPLMPDISTNLLIMTERRTYNLDLISSVGDFMPSVRFNYPADTMHAWDSFIAERNVRRQGELVLAEGPNLSPEDLNFGYEIVRGESLPWAPVRIFDDGLRTFIEMPARLAAMEAPILLFYEGRQRRLVNYRVRGRFYIADRLMTGRAVLIAGNDRVIIERRSGGR